MMWYRRLEELKWDLIMADLIWVQLVRMDTAPLLLHGTM